MSMEINIIKEQVKNIIIESMELGISPNEIDGTDLINELLISSIDAISIFVFIENTFNISIEGDDLTVELISSLDNICQFILNKINK